MSFPAARQRPPAWSVQVAGGGIASLAFALAAAQAGGAALAVSIADPRPDLGADPRAYALSAASVRMLDALGVWPTLRPGAQPITGMTITDSRTEDVVRPVYLSFEQDRSGLGFMVNGADLGRALHAACTEAGVTLLRAAVRDFDEVRGGVSVALTDGDRRSTHVLVAADGARSRLRERAGIGWTGRAYEQDALVATVAHARHHGGRAVQHFLPSGPFAILPLAGSGSKLPHLSSIVWTEERSRAREIASGPADAALTAIAIRFGPGYGALALETPLSAHPLAVGLARRFVAGRVALLGDAAHELHPLAGQGLNLGLADAAALAEAVVDAVRLGLDPGDPEVLAGYERSRRFPSLALAGLTDGLNRLFSNDRLPARSLRDIGLGLVDRSSGLKGWFMTQAAGDGTAAPRLMRGETL